MSKPGPMEIDAALKVVDRLVSAYERSCEIELEKEKVAAELELGMRRIDLEEERLNAQLKIISRKIDLDEKRLDSQLATIGVRVKLLERQQKKTFEYCDKLVELSCKTKDPAHQERILQLVFRMHSGMMGQIAMSSEGVMEQLPSVKDLGASASSMRTRQLLDGNATDSEVMS